jgi:hypothetical protein
MASIQINIPASIFKYFYMFLYIHTFSCTFETKTNFMSQNASEIQNFDKNISNCTKTSRSVYNSEVLHPTTQTHVLTETQQLKPVLTEIHYCVSRTVLTKTMTNSNMTLFFFAGHILIKNGLQTQQM